MRNWCAAVAVSALLALPVCARQAQQNGDGASAAAATTAAEKSPAKTSAGDITPAARNLFALPESPRPKPFPADTNSSDDKAPGQITPRFEIAGMFDYVNFNPGGGFSSFNNYGGSGSFTWNASRWIGLTEELGGLNYNRNVNGTTSAWRHHYLPARAAAESAQIRLLRALRGVPAGRRPCRSRR